MNARCLAKKLFLVALILQCFSLVALGQSSGFGRIGGTVQDPSGAVIPGVSVTLARPGSVGGNQTATTDERGVYQFTNLVPGTYSVRGELPGFRVSLRESIVVNADATTRVDLKLEVGEISDSVNVTADAVLLDTTTALRQTVLDRAVLNNLPSRNDIWAIANVVPGVVMSRIEVGGTESYNSSNITVHGASQTTEGAYAIDGFEFGSSKGAGASLAIYVAPSAFQEVNYQTGSASAESQRGGIVYNMVTRTGTNEYHGEFQFTGARGAMQGENISDARRRDLIAAVPAQVLARNPDFNPKGKIQGIFDASLAVTGPIIKDRLWFAGTIARAEMNKFIVGSYELDGSLVKERNKKKDMTIKLSLQLTKNQQLHFYHQENQKLAFTGASPTLFATSEVMTCQCPNSKAMTFLKWNAVLSPRLVAEAGASSFHGVNTYTPQGNVGPGALPTYDAITQYSTGADVAYGWEPNRRNMAIANLSYNTGSHDVRFGYQFMGAFYYNRQHSLSHYPSGLRAVFSNGVPDLVNTYNTPVSWRNIERNHSFFVQDKWKLSRKITLSGGLRVQSTNNWIPPTCQPTTIFIEGKCFGRTQPPKFVTLNPRFAVIYDIFGTGRTAIKLSANRYDQSLGSTYMNRVSPVNLTNDERDWNDRNGDRIPQLNELGPSTGFALGTSNRYATDLKRPGALELSGEIEHQLPGEIKIAFGYYHRETRDNTAIRNLLVPTSAYTPLVVTERTSGRQVTVYNQDAATRGRFDLLWDNAPEVDTQFNGFDVSLTKRMSNRWSMLASLSYGRNKGDVFGTADLNNPNNQFRRGLLSSDVPWQGKVSSVYELPYGIDFSARLQSSMGFPERTTVRVASATVRLNQGTVTLDVEPRGASRLPSYNMLDLGLRKSFQVSENVTIKPNLDLFNVFNADTITSRIAQLGPTYGRVSNMVAGRMMRLGFDVNF
ncbi:MAG: TonB-dependent receptor [Acidobacteria bacterium]|nr:TonB-dependent receptor [Acidobacteriota bacterium]